MRLENANCGASAFTRAAKDGVTAGFLNGRYNGRGSSVAGYGDELCFEVRGYVADSLWFMSVLCIVDVATPPTELTVQFVERSRDRFNTCLTTKRDCERGFEWRDHGVEMNMCCLEFGQIDWCVLYLSMSKDMVYMGGMLVVCNAGKPAAPSPQGTSSSAARKSPGPRPIGNI